MAAKVTTGKAFKLEGIPEMVKTLRALYKTLSAEDKIGLANNVRDVLLVPAEMIRDDARDTVPVRTGRLKSAIQAVPGQGASAVAFVDKEKAPYARMVEKGTSKMRARPYFRPAVHAVRPMAARMIAERLPAIMAMVTRENAWHEK